MLVHTEIQDASRVQLIVLRYENSDDGIKFSDLMQFFKIKYLFIYMCIFF